MTATTTEKINISKLFPIGTGKAIAGAIAGGLVAFLTALSVVVTGDKGFADVTLAQWIVVVIATLAGAGITHQSVYQTPVKAKAKDIDAALEYQESLATIPADFDPLAVPEAETPSA